MPKFVFTYMYEYTPNANMADHLVGARDESNGSEASEALMFCFGNAFPVKSCFVVDLVLFVSSFLHVFVFLNATATEWNLPHPGPQQRKCSFFQFTRSPLKRRQGAHDLRRNARTQC